ncbi:L,D-transpeptidase family protein [Scytonema sp. NUACC21]
MAETYISTVIVDLWKQEVTLVWTGPNAVAQKKGPFHCSAGEGLSGVNCDDVTTSKRSGTNCTPKGDFEVIRHERRFSEFPKAEWVTRFQDDSRGIALHYYPTVPEYPDSNGCVRIATEEAAKLIYDNTKPGKSVVSVREELRPKFGNTLKRGATGQDVRKVQRRLVEKGYGLNVDGDFGSKTEIVVKQFQKDNGLLSDGIFGQKTYYALFAK